MASDEIGLEVNADKTKFMVMSRDQNAGRSHNIKSDDSSFERVEEFKHLGTTLTDQKSIRDCLLLFGAESFALQFPIKKFKF